MPFSSEMFRKIITIHVVYLEKINYIHNNKKIQILMEILINFQNSHD